jgi:hypothetical protein
MKSKRNTIAAATSLLFSHTFATLVQETTQQNEPASKRIIKAVKKSSSSSFYNGNSNKKGGSSTGSTTSTAAAASFSWMQDENATYLDVFGEVAKDILTNQIIPETTASCDWNWMHLRCEPFCNCSYQPLWGDYHLGRSCRARLYGDNVSVTGTDTDNDSRHDGESFLQQCQNPPNTILYKGMKGIGNGLKFVWDKINWRRRLENARDQMCESLFQATASATSRGGKEGLVEGGGNGDTDDMSSSDSSQHYLLEKPVRALRKSLHCNYSTSRGGELFVLNNQQIKETSDAVDAAENRSDTRTNESDGSDEVNKEGENDAVVDNFMKVLNTDPSSSTKQELA